MDNNNFFKQIIYIPTLLLFLLCARNVFAFTLTATDNVSVSARVGEDIVVTPGGGTSSGGVTIPKTAVIFSGQAYPNADVTLLKGGEEKATVKANSDGGFTVTLEEKYNNNILYSLFAQDVAGHKSLLINYPIAVQYGFITQINGISFPPTIVTDKSQVKFGGYITVTGYAFPKKEIEVDIEGKENHTFTLTSNIDGSYKISLPMLDMPMGSYTIHARYTNETRISKLINFIIGEQDILNTDDTTNIPGDCNADKVINLVDFSVFAFWYGKNNPPSCVDTNADGKINLTDFSILAFWWTG